MFYYILLYVLFKIYVCLTQFQMGFNKIVNHTLNEILFTGWASITPKKTPPTTTWWWSPKIITTRRRHKAITPLPRCCNIWTGLYHDMMSLKGRLHVFFLHIYLYIRYWKNTRSLKHALKIIFIGIVFYLTSAFQKFCVSWLVFLRISEWFSINFSLNVVLWIAFLLLSFKINCFDADLMDFGLIGLNLASKPL